MKPGQPNVGVKINADQVGLSIAAREKDDKISYGVLDPAAFAEDGGPSIAERLSRGSAHRRLACRVALGENRAQHPPAGPRGLLKISRSLGPAALRCSLSALLLPKVAA